MIVFAKKSLLDKTMAAYKDTLRHILLNWPTDLQIPSIIHAAFSILGF